MSNPITPSSSTSGFFQTLPTLEPAFTLPSSSPHKASSSTATTTITTCQSTSDDPILARILSLYLPPQAQKGPVGKGIHDLSRLVLQPSTLHHAVDAEVNPPKLQPLTTFGEINTNDALQTSAGWKGLKQITVEKGMIWKAYPPNPSSGTSSASPSAREAPLYNRRVEQFGLCHVWSASSSVIMCPYSMSDGAATLLARHLDDPDGDQPGRGAAVRDAYRRLLSPDFRESWTSGQWMTERSGGSDVRGTESVATKVVGSGAAAVGEGKDAVGNPLGPWRIDGFKWFSSATDSDMAVMLAKTENGLSCFFVPMRRAVASPSSSPSSSSSSELNGIRIQRLKNKLGTKAVPTAELELKGARGWLLGKEGEGVKEIAAILNITRLHTAAGAVSGWGRGLAICRAYSKVRKIRGGQLLTENPQHLSWMAGETVKYWASAHLVFLNAALLGCVEARGTQKQVMHDTPSARLIDPRIAAILLRFLTPVMKGQCSLASVNGLRSCMECLGGVGYCENFEDGGMLNIAKLFRDSVVNTIWEGTGSVMADDLGRVLRDKRVAGGNLVDVVFAPWIRSVLAHCDRKRHATECLVVEERLQALANLAREVKDSPKDLEYNGRILVHHVEAVCCAALLLFDASTDRDEVASLIASRYAWSQALPGSRHEKPKSDWKSESTIDRKIFLGAGVEPFTRPAEKL